MSEPHYNERINADEAYEIFDELLNKNCKRFMKKSKKTNKSKKTKRNKPKKKNSKKK